MTMRCTVCGAPWGTADAPWGTCDCWERCSCGWSFRAGETCRNPVHREPPRDVPCPFCKAGVGEACVQRNGIRQAWPHQARERISQEAQP